MNGAGAIEPLRLHGVRVHVSAYLPETVPPERRDHLTWLFRGRYLGEPMPRPCRGLWRIDGEFYCAPGTFAWLCDKFPSGTRET